MASLVQVTLLGVMLVRGYSEDAVAEGLQRGRAQAKLIQEMVISPAVTTDDLVLAPDELRRVRTAIRAAIFHGSVVRLLLRDRSGRVVVSDDETERTVEPADAEGLAAAARGHTRVSVLDDPVPEAGTPGVIWVAQPVRSIADGRVIGTLELYLPYDAVVAQAQERLERACWRLGPGLAGLYVVLVAIAWSATRRLRRHAERHEHASLHDPLTGLGNRKLFRQRAGQAGKRAAAGERGAVVLVDLDYFKQVNDTLGHHVGDGLLQVVAERLTAGLRGSDTVARLGGDEFGLILPGVADAEVAVRLLERIRDRLTQQAQVESHTLPVHASFGIALYPDHGDGVDDWLRCADAAMYRAKRGGIVVYDSAGPAEENADGNADGEGGARRPAGPAAADRPEVSA
ncbi:GGDEF domain-containing protein [Planobispora longispora]|uniref:GGDEF domain-containing protein n=1 Tax=Planobispora longispora TaxID=28887 RepID=UPI0019410FE3|nr:GGDEF domain-containing protein [Planobispora longispora]